MQKLVVVGNSISAEIMNEYLKHDSRYEIAAFSVDADFIKTDELFGRPLVDLKSLPQTYPADQYHLLMAIGYGNLNRNREQIFDRVKEMGYQVETYIHPDAKVYTTTIGEGCLIMPNAFVDVCSEIGTNTVIWGNCSVAHHAKVSSSCWLATGCVVSGSACIDKNTFLGISSIVVNDVKVGSYNIIGAGAMVVKNTEDYDVYISGQTEKFRISAEDYLRFSKI